MSSLWNSFKIEIIATNKDYDSRKEVSGRKNLQKGTLLENEHYFLALLI